MPRSGPRTVRRYSDEFKLTAVRLSQQPGIQVQTVAAALAIHPFMLSKWRKDAREGRLRGRARKAPPAGPAREIARLQALEAKYAELREEHELLKKAIRFCSARRATSSPSSRPSARSTGSSRSAGATR
jgi:transposase